MLTAYDDDEASYSAVLAGASGYVLKNIEGHGLVVSIRKAATRRAVMDHRIPRRVVERVTSSEPRIDLSLRERQVLELIADGLTNRQIGERLELAEKTVKNYVSGLLAKLGVERRTQAAVYGATHKGL
jgi:DNA-binding NarL/FixJ family response regulator